MLIYSHQAVRAKSVKWGIIKRTAYKAFFIQVATESVTSEPYMYEDFALGTMQVSWCTLFEETYCF